MIPAAGPGHWNDPDMVRHFMQLFLRKDNFYDWIIVIIFLQLMISYIFLAYCRWLWFKLWRIQSSICYLGSHGVCKYMIIMILLWFYDSYSSSLLHWRVVFLHLGREQRRARNFSFWWQSARNHRKEKEEKRPFSPFLPSFERKVSSRETHLGTKHIQQLINEHV